jgi:uncharacterized protein (TIGR02217 family)
LRGIIDSSALTVPQIEELHNFFQAHKGRGIGFRFQPPYGYTADLEIFVTPGGRQEADGVETEFKLYVTYIVADEETEKRIIKPVAGTLFEQDGTTARDTSDFHIYFGAGNTLQNPSTYEVDNATGIVTFDTAPPVGTIIKWSGRFDLPINFETDWFNPNVRPGAVGNASGLPWLEIMPATLGIAY